jgi:hypothetical protein
VAALLVGGVTFSMIHWSNTSTYKEAPLRNEPVQLPVVPVKADFKRAKKEGVLDVAATFVDTAVKRNHVDRSFDLASPTLRTGYSRKAWATTDIPVQPYPVDFAKWKVKGSFTDEVWLQVAVFPDKAHPQVPAAVFDVVLRPFGHGTARHWLVDSWAPAGYEGIPSGPLGRNSGNPLTAGSGGATIEYKSGLSARWLLVPLSAFGLALIIVSIFAVRGWWRGQRALKRYKSGYL